MVNYFPAFYDDELLRSAIGRYHRHTLSRSWACTTEELFDKKLNYIAIDFPTRISNFSRNVEGFVRESVPDLIWNRTLLPFYAAYVGDARRKDLIEVMAQDAPVNVAVFSKLGLAVHRPAPHRFLRTCPECLRDDEIRRGETYWRRAHQLAGVHYCSRHRIPLLETQFEIHEISPTEQEFVCADFDMVTREYFGGLSDENEDCLIKLSELGAELLNKGEAAMTGQDRALKLDLLFRAGFMKGAAVIDWKPLVREFRDFYGTRVLTLLASDFEEQDSNCWLRDSIRGSRYNVPPIRRLMIDHFLESCISRAVTRPILLSGPWRCKNRAADHYGELTVTSYAFVKHSKKGRLAGRFPCSCGYEFTARLDEVGEDGQPIKVRVTKYGRILVDKVHALAAEGVPPTVIGRMMGIQWANVLKILEGRGDLRREVSHERMAQCRARRARPETQLPRKKGQAPIERNARDSALCEVVRLAANEITARRPPERITKVAIARVIQSSSLIFDIARGRLPQTEAVISQLIESIDTFRCRRVQWVYDNWPVDKPLKEWRLFHEARIPRSDETAESFRLVKKLSHQHFWEAR